jgi:hypothetical protein
MAPSPSRATTREGWDMPRVISQQHQWVVATEVDVDERRARRAVNRGTVRVAADTKVDALDVYCAMCRRSFDDACDTPCSAAESTEHLRGGPIGERAKRKHPHHVCEEVGCTEPRPDTYRPARIAT